MTTSTIFAINGILTAAAESAESALAFERRGANMSSSRTIFFMVTSDLKYDYESLKFRLFDENSEFLNENKLRTDGYR